MVLNEPDIYVVDGCRYINTGFGGDSEYARQRVGAGPGIYVAVLNVIGEPKSVEKPIAKMVQGRWQLLPNVQAVYREKRK